MTPEQRDVDAAEKLVEDWRLARPEHQWLGDRIVALVTAVRAEATREAIEALRALMPEGWADDDTMDHMPGVKLARKILAAAPAAREEGK